jgi:hypothetical protein
VRVRPEKGRDMKTEFNRFGKLAHETLVGGAEQQTEENYLSMLPRTEACLLISMSPGLPEKVSSSSICFGEDEKHIGRR